MKKKSFLLLCLLLLPWLSVAQTHTLMSYNLLNYPGSDTTTRNPYYRTIFQSIKPDIIAVQEIQSQAGVDGFLNNVLNADTVLYAAGVFINGPDTDRAIFYKTQYFTFISNTSIPTTLRDINEFKVVHNLTQDTLRLYTVHLKASTGSSNELQRLAEVTTLRGVTDGLDTNSHFIVLGDFNIYSSNEPAFQKLLNQSTTGYFIDPLNLTGTFNQSAYARHHTQSTRTRSFGGGATGGLDDRFDMILVSRTLFDSSGVYYIPGSTIPYGNDGFHYNDSINKPPNNTVGQLVADALHYASDHLPVVARFEFDNVIPVEFPVFTASVHNRDVHINWSTLAELNNAGFEIERMERPAGEWRALGFVQGMGTTNQVSYYEFWDYGVPVGSYSYRYKQFDSNGSYSYSQTLEIVISPPDEFVLYQNYPNPFNPSTVIRYQIPDAGFVRLSVYDVLGSEIEILMNEYQQSGFYEVEFYSDNVASGIYVLGLHYGGRILTRKMVVLK